MPEKGSEGSDSVTNTTEQEPKHRVVTLDVCFVLPNIQLFGTSREFDHTFYSSVCVPSVYCPARRPVLPGAGSPSDLGLPAQLEPSGRVEGVCALDSSSCRIGGWQPALFRASPSQLCCGSRAAAGTEASHPSAQPDGVSLFPLSPTHAPWLLAHKIQSPQEKEALYALTVSPSGPWASAPLPAGPSPVSAWGVDRGCQVHLHGPEKAGAGSLGSGAIPGLSPFLPNFWRAALSLLWEKEGRLFLPFIDRPELPRAHRARLVT